MRSDLDRAHITHTEYTMRTSLVAATVTLAAALALPAAAQTGEVSVKKGPGTVTMARTLNVSATITAVDATTREVTLKGPQGRELKVIAKPEVKNFSQLKAGDQVDVQYFEALAVGLRKGGGLPVARTEEARIDPAPTGASPEAYAGRRVTVVGDVIDVDAKMQTVTLRGPQNIVELSISDPEQFKRIAKGDQIEAQYVEAAAVSIVPHK
jgi:hypothetical protein